MRRLGARSSPACSSDELSLSGDRVVAASRVLRPIADGALGGPRRSVAAMDTPTLTAAVRRELLVRSEVTESPHRFGGIEFRLGRRELGHLHGDRIADLPFARHVRDELVAAGRAEPHHLLPDSGWVTRRVRGPEDVEAIVGLFAIS